MDLPKLRFIWINVNENLKSRTTFGGSLSYKISTKPMKWFTEFGKVHYGFM
jgi:hypothetical protein